LTFSKFYFTLIANFAFSVILEGNEHPKSIYSGAVLMIFKKMIFAILFLSSVVVFIPTANAHEHSMAPSLEKIYIEPYQLHILPEGIFFLNEENCLESTYGVFHDEDGLYVIKYYQCPVCRWWFDARVCRNKKCLLYLR